MHHVVKPHLLLAGSVVLALLLLPPSAQAQDLLYEPRIPAFGGSGVNTSFLFQSANAQNPYDGSRSFGFRDDPLQDFEQQLQRRVLDQISRQVIEQRFGDIDLTQEGTFNFDQFTVDVTPGPSGISIRVFNKQTGESSTIEVPRF